MTDAQLRVALAQVTADTDIDAIVGRSVIIDPFGRIVAMGGTAPDLVVGDIDITALRRLQKSEGFRRVSAEL